MEPSAWDRLQAMETPISRYQRKFSKHGIPSGILKLAADTGKIPQLKAAAQQAVETDQPILNWSDFIPSYVRSA
jgi:hypothetical protein